MVTLSNANNVFNGSGAQITVVANATVTVNGNDNAIATAADDNLTLTGAGNTVSAPADVTMTVMGGGNSIQAITDIMTLGGTGGLADTVSGVHLSATLEANSHLILNASIVALALGDNCLVIGTGDDTNFQGSDDKIYINQATVGGDSLAGDSDRVILGAASLLEISGNNEYVHLGAKASMALTGTNARLVGAGFYASASNGSDFWVGGTGVGGAIDAITASDCTIRIGANSNIAVHGDDDTMAVRGNSTVYIQGDGLLAHFGRNATVLVTSTGPTGALDVVTGAYFTANVNAASHVELATFGATAFIAPNSVVELERSDNTLTATQMDTISILWGSSNTISLGGDDVINDGGSGTVIQAGYVGAATINNFAADVGGIIELLGGAGAYTTPAAAYAALASDGHGGVELSLGISGSIDFAGTSASQLSAASFKIG